MLLYRFLDCSTTAATSVPTKPDSKWEAMVMRFAAVTTSPCKESQVTIVRLPMCWVTSRDSGPTRERHSAGSHTTVHFVDTQN